MNDFFNRLRWRIQQMMRGRYGADKLTQAQLWVGLGLYILNLFLRWRILMYLAMGIYIWAIYRMFSRNRTARAIENQKLLQFWYALKAKPAKYMMRLKSSREYKYFHCSKCHTLLRTPRHTGNKTITCPKCKNQFKIKS